MRTSRGSDEKGKGGFEDINIEYHPEAADELMEAARYYEERQSG